MFGKTDVIEKKTDNSEAPRKKSRWKLIVPAVVLLILAGVAVLSRMDFLGGFVREKVTEVAAKELSADITIGAISGNPLTGLTIEDVGLSRSGDKIVSVKSIGARISVPSIAAGSPKLSVVDIEGFEASLDELLDLIPKNEDKPDEPADIPVERVFISDSMLHTKWGTVELDPSTVRIKNSQNFKIDAAGNIAGKAFMAAGGLEKKKGSWSSEKFFAQFGSGKADVSGAVYPSADMNISLDSLNISEVADIFPDILKYGVRGLLSGKASVSGSTSSDITTQGTGNLRDAVVSGIPISDLQAKWDVKPGHITVTVDQGKVFDSVLNGKLSLNDVSGEKHMSLKADVKNFKFADWSDKLKEETEGYARYLKGKISSFSADLSGPLNALKGRIDLSPSDISYKDIVLKSLAGSAVFDGRPAGTVDVSAMADGRKAALKGLLSFGNKVPTDVSFAIDGYPIEKVLRSLPQAGDIPASGTIAVKGTCSGLPGRWVVSANASSAAISVPKIGQISDVNCAAKYEAADKKLTLSSASADFNGAKIAGSGTVRTGAPQGGSLDLKGTFRNADAKRFYDLVPALKDLNIQQVASGTWSISGTPASPVIRTEAAAASGKFRALQTERLKTKVEYKNGVIRLDPLDADACGGHCRIVCDIALPSAKGGTVSWKLGGRVTSADFSVINGLLNADEDISGSVTGDVTAGSAAGGGINWGFKFKGDKVRWREFKADSIDGVVEGSPEEIVIKKADGAFLKGDASVTGRIKMPPADRPFADAALDLSATIKDLNLYELLRKHFPSVRSVQGLLEAKADIRGTAGAPVFSASGRAAPLLYRGRLVPITEAKCRGTLKDIEITEITPALKDGIVKGTGHIYEKNGEWFSEINIKGDDVGMKQFGTYIPEEFRSRLGGRANFTMDLTGDASKIKGKGSFNAPELTIMGVEFKDVKAPFFVTQNYMMVEDLSAGVGGGTLNGGVGLDFKDSKWGGSLTVISSDIESLVKQALPDLKGRVTGRGDLKVRGGGETGRASTIKGGGALKLYDGEVTSFDAIESAKKFTGGKPLRFHNVQASFTYDGGDINILPGSQATAPKNDTVYNYMMLDGFISRKKELSLFSMGKINIRALNSLIGAFGSIADAGSDIISGRVDSSELLHSLVGGVIKGLTKSEFRFVTLNVGGTTENPDFYNIKVQGTTMQTSAKDSIPTSNSDPDARSLTKKGDTRFRFKFEIPVGPGNGGYSGDTSKGQSFENLFNAIDFSM